MIDHCESDRQERTVGRGGPEAPAALAARHLRCCGHGWSIGMRGALGEFMYGPGEPVDLRIEEVSLGAVTARGAIALELSPPVQCTTFELAGGCGGARCPAIAFHLPAAAAALSRHDELTELGPDHDAVAATGRHEILFDLGLGSAFVQFCVRTADPALLRRLRAAIGRPVFEPANRILATIREASPARVVCSALGRIEVYQPIPADDGASPSGPHTHLLPALLGGKDRTAPLPAGRVACAMLYPAARAVAADE